MANGEPTFNTLWTPDYTALDYNAMRDETLDYVRARYEAEGIQDDFLQSNAAVMTTDSQAYIGSLVAQRTEDLAAEMYLPSVQRRENLLKLMRLVGQQPRLPVSSQIPVFLTADQAPLANVSFPLLFNASVEGLDGNQHNVELMAAEFDYYTPVILPAGVQQMQAYMFEGRSQQDVFVSSGAARQVYRISQYPVVEGSIAVSVHPKPYNLITAQDLATSRITQVESLVTPLDEMVYRMEVTYRNEVILYFATDQFGRVPPRGWYVYVDYRVGGGAAGNIAVGALDKKFTLKDDLGRDVSVTFTNPTSTGIGGEDEESLEIVRERAPARTRSVEHFTTRPDYYDLLVQKMPDVISAIYVLDYETDRRLNGGTARTVPQNGVYIWVLPKTGELLTQEQRQILRTYLEDLNMIAVEHYIFDANFNDWDLRAKVYYSKRLDRTLLEERIRSILLYHYGQFDYDGEPTGNLEFQRIIRLSQLYRLIQEQIGSEKDGHAVLSLPSSDLDPFASVGAPRYGEVLRLDAARITLEFEMLDED